MGLAVDPEPAVFGHSDPHEVDMPVEELLSSRRIRGLRTDAVTVAASPLEAHVEDAVQRYMPSVVVDEAIAANPKTVEARRAAVRVTVAIASMVLKRRAAGAVARNENRRQTSGETE
jgi:hypothetical protein